MVPSTGWSTSMTRCWLRVWSQSYTRSMLRTSPWHAGCIEQREDLVDIPLRQQRVDPFGESDPVDDALGVGRKALLGRVHAERRGEP